MEAGGTGSPSHKGVKDKLALTQGISTGGGPGFQFNQSELALKPVWDGLICIEAANQMERQIPLTFDQL